MSLTLANMIASDLDADALGKHIEFCALALEAKKRSKIPPPPSSQTRTCDLDEHEPRRTWPSPDTIPALPQMGPTSEEDDCG